MDSKTKSELIARYEKMSIKEVFRFAAVADVDYGREARSPDHCQLGSQSVLGRPAELIEVLIGANLSRAEVIAFLKQVIEDIESSGLPIERGGNEALEKWFEPSD